MLAAIERTEEFFADHPILIIVVILVMREIYNLLWKHHSTKVSWQFPKTTSWLQVVWKIVVVIGIAIFLGLCSFLIIIPLLMLVGKMRKYLLKKTGHGDMQYHAVKIST